MPANTRYTCAFSLLTFGKCITHAAIFSVYPPTLTSRLIRFRVRILLLQWTLQQLQPGLVVSLRRCAGARLDMLGPGPRSDGSTVGDVVVLLRGTDVLLARMASECGYRVQLLNDPRNEGSFSLHDPQDVAVLESASRVCSLKLLALYSSLNVCIPPPPPPSPVSF